MNWWTWLITPAASGSGTSPLNALVGGSGVIIGAVIALGGVWLTQRLTHRRWIDERNERQRATERQAVADVLVMSSVWRQRLMRTLKSMAGKEMIELQRQDLIREWDEQQQHEFARVLVIASLLIKDKSTRSDLSDLSIINDDRVDALGRFFRSGLESEQDKQHMIERTEQEIFLVLDNLESSASYYFGLTPRKRLRWVRNVLTALKFRSGRVARSIRKLWRRFWRRLQRRSQAK